jgi:hypothetical protein
MPEIEYLIATLAVTHEEERIEDEEVLSWYERKRTNS